MSTELHMLNYVLYACLKKIFKFILNCLRSLILIAGERKPGFSSLKKFFNSAFLFCFNTIAEIKKLLQRGNTWVSFIMISASSVKAASFGVQNDFYVIFIDSL